MRLDEGSAERHLQTDGVGSKGHGGGKDGQQLLGRATREPIAGTQNQIMPAKNGGRKSPMVPRKHTIINNQRNILSMTMATYFQSSFTCR